ncbi:MAG: GDSL-type esterase/lipase family protein [Oscillospiraceae bacterium]|nr:GDSL-type esterase/lipase family protein [Oscillospiraceae bacterium]
MAVYSSAQPRKPRRRSKLKQRFMRFCLLVVAAGMIVLIAWLITAIFDAVSPPKVQDPYFTPTENVFDNPPQPEIPFGPDVSVGTQLGLVQREAAAGPLKREEAPQLTPLNAANIALPENRMGMVDSSYFSDALFVGDSLTEGIELYIYHNFYSLPDTTKYLWMRGITPMDMLTGTWNATMPYDWQTQVRTGETIYTSPLEDIVAANPGKLYLMLGTNCLTGGQSDEIILKYYGQLIDALQERLPNMLIYIQSMTPVGIEKEQENPEQYGAARIALLNEQIAKMAYAKGVCYLDVHTVLADESDHLKDEWNYDGWHMTPEAYKAWFQYLTTHTLHRPDNSYIKSSAYGNVVTLPQTPGTETPQESGE